jgi:RNA polymerase sigma-70 factor, ECF subfamily
VTDFDALYAAHRDDVWRYFRRRAPADHEDLVTEVFLVAWRRREDVPREPLPWLYGVARKVLANHRRAGDRREALTERAAAHAMTAAPDLAEAAGLRTDLARALAALPDHDRELVLLVAWEGLTLAEAATALGCRRGAAAVRLHRARRRLHTALNDESGPALASMTALEER